MPLASVASLPLLYLCRHGQTDWNAAARLQGQSDIPLNALGREQAARNGRALGEILGESAGTFRFVSSPMSRACETMRIARREMGLDVDAFETDERLKEIHFGDWQGFTMREMRRTDPLGVQRRDADKWNFLPPGDGAESYEQLAARIKPVFETMTQPTIVTAHGGIARAFLYLFAGLPAADAAQADVPQDRILRFENGSGSWV